MISPFDLTQLFCPGFTLPTGQVLLRLHNWHSRLLGGTQTVTRASCRQCDNPAKSHTAFLSRFHTCCKSPFWLHNQQSWLLGGSPVEILQSYCFHTQFHWSIGPPICFPPCGTRVQSPGGYLCETGILLLRFVCLQTFAIDILKPI